MAQPKDSPGTRAASWPIDLSRFLLLELAVIVLAAAVGSLPRKIHRLAKQLLAMAA